MARVSSAGSRAPSERSRKTSAVPPKELDRRCRKSVYAPMSPGSNSSDNNAEDAASDDPPIESSAVESPAPAPSTEAREEGQTNGMTPASAPSSTMLRPPAPTLSVSSALAALFTATATALTEGDILARFEALEAKNMKLEAKNTEITAKYTEIQATLNATTSGELKMFNAEECPPGWVEFNKTQGYLLTGRPKGGVTGTTINRPMDVGEEGRSPEHSHEVGVEDLGHTHVTTVNDPGHKHYVTNTGSGQHGGSNDYPCVDHFSTHGMPTDNATTGIVVDALPAKSNIQVSLTTNKDGEGYPLVYILICQRVLAS